ncbi:hypothetical protein PIB30_012935 [Stylosanthes scabra]|uniref:Uncharacterized protein n=1 Tax=Stylosanthes scabra TaxID=79078 RepID=A0ABU6Y332_9FABA|nr:hypothetical protein [Stylosanthes scabra]
MAALDEPKSTTFDSGEPYLNLILSNRRVREFLDLFKFYWQYPPGALTLTLYALATDGSGSGSGPGVPRSAYPMCDARRYHSLFPHRRIAPPTPPPPSPPSSDEEPSAETYDLAAELVGDPDEPYVAEHVPYGAPEAYYSDASYGSERESASTDTAPSSHHSSGSSSGNVSLGYGSASSGSASDGASDDDLVNRYFTGTFPPP